MSLGVRPLSFLSLLVRGLVFILLSSHCVSGALQYKHTLNAQQDKPKYTVVPVVGGKPHTGIFQASHCKPPRCWYAKSPRFPGLASIMDLLWVE